MKALDAKWQVDERCDMAKALLLLPAKVFDPQSDPRSISQSKIAPADHFTPSHLLQWLIISSPSTYYEEAVHTLDICGYGELSI